MKKQVKTCLILTIGIALVLVIAYPVPGARCQVNGNHQSTNPANPFMMLPDEIYYDDSYSIGAYEANYYRIYLEAGKYYVFYFYAGNDYMNATLVSSSNTYILYEDDVPDGQGDGDYFLITPPETSYYNLTMRCDWDGSAWTSCWLAFLEIPVVEYTGSIMTFETNMYWDFDANGFIAVMCHFNDLTSQYKGSSLGYSIYYTSTFSFVNYHMILTETGKPTLTSTPVQFSTSTVLFFSPHYNQIRIERVQQTEIPPAIPGFLPAFLCFSIILAMLGIGVFYKKKQVIWLA